MYWRKLGPKERNFVLENRTLKTSKVAIFTSVQRVAPSSGDAENGVGAAILVSEADGAHELVELEGLQELDQGHVSGLETLGEPRVGVADDPVDEVDLGAGLEAVGALAVGSGRAAEGNPFQRVQVPGKRKTKRLELTNMEWIGSKVDLLFHHASEGGDEPPGVEDGDCAAGLGLLVVEVGDRGPLDVRLAVVLGGQSGHELFIVFPPSASCIIN